MHPPARCKPHRDVAHHKPSPTEYTLIPKQYFHSVMLRQSPSNNGSSPAEVFIPAEYFSTIITSPAAAVSRLETWSDSGSEQTYLCYFPARGINGLQPCLATTIDYSP